MTDEPNKATMTVENVTFGSKSAAGRGTLKLTYSSTEYPELNQFLIDQVSNPIDLTFSRIQGKLGLELVQKAAANNGATPATKDEPDAEIVEMIVEGEPAKVRRPRKSSSNGNGASADDKPPYSYHAFREDGTAPGLCAECHKRQNDAGHELAPWPAEDKPLPHAFRRQGRSNRCGWCHVDASSELHAIDAPMVTGWGEDEEEAPSAVENLTDTLLAGLEDDAQPAAEAVGVGEGA